MNEIMNISGIDCYEKDGTAYLKLETVARGLGFTRIANSGNEVIRWETVRKYLTELSVPTCWHEDSQPVGKEGLPDFIPENIFYRLAMKAKNETAEKFQALVADEIIPSIRKTGAYRVPITIPEQIQLLAKGNVEIHKRMDDMQSEITSIKLDLPILPIEADKITGAVRKKGVEILGGKESAAYNDRGLRQLLYNSIYANVKYNFNIKSYKSLKRCECDKAIEIINEYQPPFYLRQQIETSNLQQRFDAPC